MPNRILSTEDRAQIHQAFNDWLNVASEEDNVQLGLAREAFAPNQVCSAITLIQGCMTDDQLEQQLPASLRALLRERNLQRAFFDGKSRAA